jgi:hypothetical protein
MKTKVTERVYDADFHHVMFVDERDGTLVILTDEGDTVDSPCASITLDLHAVKKLRLALARFERNQKAG